MLICVAGDTHGALETLYRCVAELEAQVGRQADLVLQVGDLGVWPDPERLDAATRRHGEPGGFRRYLAAGAVPRPTVFIAGNHEDFDYLTAQPPNPLPAGMRFLPWGQVLEVEAGGQTVRLGGIGGCFGKRDYSRLHPRGTARRHYTSHDLEQLTRQAAGGLDVLLLHEPPAGPVTELHAPPGLRCRSWELPGEGLAGLVATVRPRLCFSGHIHARTERNLAGVRTIGLHKVPCRGSVLLLELPPQGPALDLAEWGGAPGAPAPVLQPVEVEADDGPTLSALASRLGTWAAAVRAGRNLDRQERKRLHGLLAGDPHRALLMGALLGGDPRALLERDLPPGQRDALLDSWMEGEGLPDPSHLR